MPDHAVYRLRDDAGALLYVGASDAVFVRLEQHVARQPWWHQVAYADIEFHASHAAMVDAELAAIRTEAPTFNVQGRGGHSQRRPTPDAPQPLDCARYFRTANG